MASKQRINSNFYEIGVSDSSGNIIDVNLPGNLIVGGTANLNNVGNVYIAAGGANQIVSTYGNGTLYWANIPNTVGGLNGQVQYNKNGLFGGNTSFTYNAAASTMSVTNEQIANAFVATGVANFGAVGNLKIAGGSNGQILTTDGAGNLSWTTVSATAITPYVTRYTGTFTAATSSNFTITVNTLASGFSALPNLTNTGTGFQNSSASGATFLVSTWVKYQQQFPTNTGLRSFYWTDGTVTDSSTQTDATPSTTTDISFTMIKYLAPGATMTLRGNQGSGATIAGCQVMVTIQWIRN